MSHHHDTPVIDRRMIRAAALLVVISIAGAGYARVTGDARVVDDRSDMVSALDLHFADREDGAVVVHDGREELGVFASGDGGFLRGAVRALVRSRRLAGLDDDEPFRLVHWRDGRVSLEDPQTGQTIVLNAFGPDNLEPFAALLRRGQGTTASLETPVADAATGQENEA